MKVAEILVPAISVELDRIIARRVETVVRNLAEAVVEETNKTVERLEVSNRLLRYECDRLEQYSRRETVRITGLAEEEREDTEKKVLEVFQAAGCNVKTEEISVVHRNGKRNDNGKPRPILVRFTSRKSKAAVMQNRKALKDRAPYQKVYINDDLTLMRSKLLYKCKNTSTVQSVRTTHDGKILCTMKSAPGHTGPAKTVAVETPDDLFHLGVDNISYAEFGVDAYGVPAQALAPSR
nr:hypothetical protein BaRGS_019455 [Batillaria attramentaria]